MAMALLLMDLQNEIVDPRGKIGSEGLAEPTAERQVLERVRDLLSKVRSSDVQILHVVMAYRKGHRELPRDVPLADWFRNEVLLVEGTWGAEIHPLVSPLPDEIVVTKRGVSAFANSELDGILRSLNVRELVLAGVATRFVVEGTARDAFELGYRFSVLEDCCASSSVEMHEAAIDYMSRFGDITTSQEWLIANGK